MVFVCVYVFLWQTQPLAAVKASKPILQSPVADSTSEDEASQVQVSECCFFVYLCTQLLFNMETIFNCALTIRC